MKKSLEKKKYFILSFVKYMNYFFLALESPDTYTTILTTVEMETGKWGETIKTSVGRYGEAKCIVDGKIYYVIENEKKTLQK